METVGNLVLFGGVGNELNKQPKSVSNIIYYRSTVNKTDDFFFLRGKERVGIFLEITKSERLKFIKVPK